MNKRIDEFPKLRRWAVVGASEDPNKFGNKIYHDLKRAGYTVHPVNPTLETLDGDPCYKSLKDIPEKPDVVDLVVPPKVSFKVIDDCIALGLKRVWFQPGSESPEAITKAEEEGLKVVHSSFIMVKKQLWKKY